MELKKCPYCGKSILVLAKTCKYCGESIELIEQNVPNQELIAEPKQQFGQNKSAESPPLNSNFYQPNKQKSNFTKIAILVSVIVVVLIIIVLTISSTLNKNETVVGLADTDFVDKQNILPQQKTITLNNGNTDNNSSPTNTKTLKGKVGKLEAIYTLVWHSDGTINGTYKYYSRPNKVYTLKGFDLKNGTIELTEYTGSNISAKCNLALQGNCYVGQMNNNDGRILNMTMCEVFESAKDITLTNSLVPGSFPQASQRLLKPSDLDGMSQQDLKIMRNEIFARYGLIFKTSEMKSYFSAQSWYNGRYEDVSSYLSDIERKNIALIKHYE